MFFNLFDYISYRVCRVSAARRGMTDLTSGYGATAVALLLFLNAFSLFLFGIDIFRKASPIPLLLLKLYVALFMVGCAIFYYYRINKIIGLSNLLNKWDNADEKVKKRFSNRTVIYLILTFVCLVIGFIFIPLEKAA
jgi:hypothetical protein